jgi:transposase
LASGNSRSIRRERHFLPQRRADNRVTTPEWEVVENYGSGTTGLPGMRERAELVGGELTVWSEPDSGTEMRPFEKLADMLVNHLEGILNYCRMKVPMGVVEAVNGNIKSLLRRGRGYTNLRYLLLKAQRMAVTKTEFVVFRKAA